MFPALARHAWQSVAEVGWRPGRWFARLLRRAALPMLAAAAAVGALIALDALLLGDVDRPAAGTRSERDAPG